MIFGNITSSGNISASGDITGNSITATSASLKHITNLTGITNDNIIVQPSVTFQNPPQFNNGILGDAVTGNSELKIGTSGFLGNTVSVNLTGTITASGNISASGDIIGGGLNINGTTTFNDGNITNIGGIQCDSIVDDATNGTGMNLNPSDIRFRVAEVLNVFTIGASGNVTASGNISASGDIVGNNLSGTNTGDQDLSSLVTNSSTASFAITGSNVLFGNITSSGNISASSTIIANGLDIRGSGNATTFNDANITNVGQISLDSLISDGGGDNQIILNTADMDHRINDSGVMTLKEFAVEFFNDGVIGHITSSGNISASGDIIANKVTADVIDTSFETFLNFEAATAFTFIAPFAMTINFTGSSTSSMDIVDFVTASANTSTFSTRQGLPLTLNIFDKLKITPSSSGLFSFSGSRTI